MDSINITNYLEDFTITDRTAITASDYYEEQTRSLAAGQVDNTSLAWDLAQGWRITADNGLSGASRAVTLKRDVLKTKDFLDDMIAEYVDLFNEGRTINDDRYDDIINLAQAAIARTENELNISEVREEAIYVYLATMIDGYEGEFTTHETDSEDAFDDWGDAEETRIDNEYDAELASIKSRMIDSGWYNTATYGAAELGAAREKSEKLEKLAQKQLELQDSLRDRLYRLQRSMRDGLVSARTRLDAQLQGQRNSRVSIVNNIIQAVMNFAERRTDSYPDMTKVGDIVANLGKGTPAGQKP